MFAGLETDPVADGTATYTRTPGGSVTATTTGTTTRWTGTNRHGDITQLLDPAATNPLIGSQTFDPFGQPISAPALNLGYQGDWTDPTTKQPWMAARWYQPNTATFTTRDTLLGSIGGPTVNHNRHTYANNNPLTYWDPTGRVAVIDNLNERLTNDEEQRILAALTKGEDVDINVSDKEIEEYLSDQQNVELLIGDALQVIGLGKYKYTPADFIRLLNLRVDVNASQKASAKNLQLRILLAHSLANSFAASKHFEKTLYRDFDSHINVKSEFFKRETAALLEGVNDNYQAVLASLTITAVVATGSVFYSYARKSSWAARTFSPKPKATTTSPVKPSNSTATPKQSANGPGNDDVVEVVIDAKKYPQSAQHIEDAQAAGQPKVLTVDRSGAAARRRDSLRGTVRQAGKDRDEYPPAMTAEGGQGASVRPISPSDNRGAGACIGSQCRNVPNGAKIRIEVKR